MHLHQFNALLTPALYAVVIVAMITEGLLLMRLRFPIRRKEGWVSMASGALAFGGLFLAGKAFFFMVYDFFFGLSFVDLGMGWEAWLIAFIAYDAMFYLSHWMGHRVRLLWCMHAVHHTPQEMRLTTAVRGSVLDFLYLPWFYCWLPLLGISPLLLMAVESLSRLWGVFTHVSDKAVGSMGPLEGWLVTPSAHRVHHGRNPAYLDTNYGEVLLLWDRLFGTYCPQTEQPDYGTIRPVDTESLVESQFHAFADLWDDLRQAPSWRDRVCYLLCPPGWRHDGRHRTSEVLREEAKASP